MNYCQSGNLGDLIYSLAVVKKLGSGNFYVKLNNIPNLIQKYNNGVVPPTYMNKLSRQDFDLLKPLLEQQSYINKVKIHKKESIDIDLDEFRGVIHSKFNGNFIEAFYRTHNINYTRDELIEPWLSVDEPKQVAKYVVARSPRWRRNLPSTIDFYKHFIQQYNFVNEAVFVGLPEEHTDFVNTFNVNIKYYQVSDFLELAQVINGCEMFFGNQTFTYGIAQGLGKSTVLETFTDRVNLLVNECFFARPNCYYF